MKTLLCVYCRQAIFDRHAISGAKVENWATGDNDFGCDENPISGEEGVGSHEPDFDNYSGKEVAGISVSSNA